MKKIIDNDARSLFEFIEQTLADLEISYQETKDFRLKEKISAIETYSALARNKAFIASMRTLFNGLYAHLDKEMPDLTFELSGRKKAFASFYDKLEMKQIEKKSIDSVFRDMFGYRLITLNCNTDNPETIKKLYRAMNLTIEFFIEKGMILCQAEHTKDTTGFNPAEHPEIFVPEASFLSENYLYGVKDYILTPKKNGYQALQAVFKTNKGNMFEIQFKTLSMSIRSTYGSSSHYNYKNTTREVTEWNLQDSNIPGLNCVNVTDPKTGETREIIDDHIGFINPLTIFSRSKTFN